MPFSSNYAMSLERAGGDTLKNRFKLGLQAGSYGVLTLAALSLASPVAAQANFTAMTIGQVVGGMAAQEEAARQEAACRAGQPAAPKAVAAMTDRAQRVMTAYWALKSTAKAPNFGRVFAMDSENLRWQDDHGITPVSQLGDQLNPPSTPPTLTVAVVAGDALAVRAQWTSQPSTATAEPTVYSADFTTDDGHMFDYARGVRILHMSVMPASKAPPAPGAFCHLDAKRGY